MTHRRIVISDVHGHYNALRQLLEAIAPSSSDQIYFIGDLIDRGPQSAEVVQLVMDHKYHCLLGNHEQMLLAAVGNGGVHREYFQAWLYSGGYATVESYNNKIPQDHINWIKSLPTYLDLGDFWLVHAGVDPKLSISEQGSEQFCWIRREFHSMTRPYFTDKQIITGHTITFTLPGIKPGKLAKGPGWIDIEAGAYHPNSGWLTGLDLDEKKVYQVNTKDGSKRRLSWNQAIVAIDPSKVLLKPYQGKD